MKISIQSLHTTELGALRVKRNLNLETDDVVAWCRAVLAMDNLYLGNIDGLWTNTAATFRNSKDPYVKKAIYNQLSSFINVYLVSLQKNIANGSSKCITEISCWEICIRQKCTLNIFL